MSLSVDPNTLVAGGPDVGRRVDTERDPPRARRQARDQPIRELAVRLERRCIPHQLDVWGYDVSHDWPWWQQMALPAAARVF